MWHRRVQWGSQLGVLCLAISAPSQAADLRVLFLGDNGPHQPRARFAQLQPVLARRGLELTYTDQMADLNPQTLGQYDALLLYANIDVIEPPQATALIRYVEQGGGFVPLHCATYCFRNSSEVVALMGAQFQRHGTGVFRAEIATPDHPVLQGFGGFESWDETYVHHLHNERDRMVLCYRVDAEGREPWTWIRTQGEGRVFYTASGHDQRTWRHPGFHNLVERGIRWAAKNDPTLVPAYDADRPFPVPPMTSLASDPKPFTYREVGREIPNYVPSEQWGVQGEALSKMQEPLEPQESLKHLVVPQGFHVELFAAEPDIGGKPICMAWDERGRLWIAETYDYPNELQPVGEGRDRIRILEDTDGDARADKFTVFAEKLSIPTSIAFHQGGVVVQNGTQTLYLKDLDGDDVADQSTVMFTGWAVGDTHGGVSNFQYGLDNWIWGMQGYNQSRPVVAGKPLAYSFRQGFLRFRPDGSELEFLRSTNNNTWGLGISEEGIVFGSTANRNPSVYLPIPNRYYERVAGWAPSLVLGTIADTYLFRPITTKVRQVDQHGGYTAGAGHALYTARAYPKEYWNRVALVNGPTGHLVGAFVLSQDGSDFRSTSPFNLLASDDEWTAPIMSEVGPDGQVWVIDWYNYIVQHNPTPEGFQTGKGNAYETKLRDKKHGRIYRVVYGDQAAGRTSFSLAGASPAKLVEALSHPTMLWRKHAQRLLVERGLPDVVPQLIELVRDESVDEIGLNVGAIHALWTLHGLGRLDGSDEEAQAAACAALSHPSRGVRRNALQVLPPSAESTQALLRAGLLAEEDGQIRLTALLALADLPADPQAGPAIFEVLQAAALDADRWIPDAAISAAATHPGGFLRAAAKSPEPTSEKVIEAIKIVAAHFARVARREEAAGLIHALAAAPRDEVVEAVVTGMAVGWPSGLVSETNSALDADLRSLVGRLGPASGGRLVALARRLGSPHFEEYAREVSSSLLAKLDDESLGNQTRAEAASEVVRFNSADAEVVAELLDRITPQTDTDLAIGMMESLSGSESAAVGEMVPEVLPTLLPKPRAAAIGVLLKRPRWTQGLLNAIERREVPLADLTLEQRQLVASHPDGEIRRQARRLLEHGGALPSADRQKVLADLAWVTRETGDATAGKAVFTKHCGTCHMHSGEGKKIGPDLTGMAVHPKLELLTHVIDPNRDVEGNYRVYVVVTHDGRALSGLLSAESNTMIELLDAKGETHTVLREDVDEISASGVSLMPEGFEKELKPQELTDLLEFLAQRGSFLPLDLREAATITSVRGMFDSKQASVERLVLDDWSPKTVKGVPFELVDPREGEVNNAILLHGPLGRVSRTMPQSVKLRCDAAARTVHLLSGVSGWGYPFSRDHTVSMIVRLTYANGETEDHELLNGVHFADYIREVEVPKSELAFKLRDQQMRYLSLSPRQPQAITQIEFVKGEDQTAPLVMAVTLELR
jgi:putative membrane-bound dehydrogenase-like protein